MIQRFLSSVICAAFVAALFAGCASTRTASFPKINWAFWKKKESPGGRHDEAIAAPSSSMSPVNSLVKSDKSEAALATANGEKPRKPYDTGVAPPEPRAFGSSTPANPSANDSAVASSKSNSASSPNVGAVGSTTPAASVGGGILGAPASSSVETTLAKSMENTPRKTFELSQANPPGGVPGEPLKITGSNNYVPGQAALASLPASSASTTNAGNALAGQRVANPYASGSIEKSTASSSPISSSPLMPAADGNVKPQYARTPYNEFTPKTPNAQSNAIAASTGNSTVNPLQPLNPSPPRTGNSMIGGANSPAATTGQSNIAQVSYTPGSIGSSRPLNELLAGTMEPSSSPAIAAPAPTPLANTALPPANPPTSAAETNSERIGGGGSFRIVK